MHKNKAIRSISNFIPVGQCQLLGKLIGQEEKEGWALRQTTAIRPLAGSHM